MFWHVCFECHITIDDNNKDIFSDNRSISCVSDKVLLTFFNDILAESKIGKIEII